MRKKNTLLSILILFLLLFFIGNAMADSYVTDEGTKINITLNFDDEWELDKNNNVRISFEVEEFGSDVRDCHDIELSVRVKFPDKTYSDSAGTWSIETEGDSVSYTFGFYVSSNDVSEGQTGSVYYNAEWKEDVAWQTDPSWETGWKAYGDVEIPSEPEGFAKLAITQVDCPSRVKENEAFTLRVTVENTGTIEAKDVRVYIEYDYSALRCEEGSSKTIGTLMAKEKQTVSWILTAEKLAIGSSGDSTIIEITASSMFSGSEQSSVAVNIEPKSVVGGLCFGTILISVISVIALITKLYKPYTKEK